MTSNFHTSLLKDISLMLNADDYNVIVQVGETDNTKEFYAHSNILRARSPHFRNAFSADNIRKENNIIMLKKHNITPNIFEMILKYIYMGELDLKNQSETDIFKLLIASNEFYLEELVNYLQEYLIDERTCWVQQNFVFILNTIFNLSNYKKLQDYCILSICEDPFLVFSLSDFSSLNKDILFYLIKQDDLAIDEIVAWDYLIIWGMGQIPELKNRRFDMDEWTEKSYVDLKNALSNFIPLIKFIDITSEDFYDKVRPYEVIFPNNMYEDLLAYYLVEQPKLQKYIPKIESSIIIPKLANVISNWIDKTNDMYIRTESDPLYNFDLIYRGSRDGIRNKSFRKKCKSQLASLVLVKVHQSDKIFGGYSSIGFNPIGNSFIIEDGLKFYYASDNFIFSFEDGEDIQDRKISRVVNYSKSILVRKSGFNFGWGSLSMIDQNLYVNNRSGNYEKNLNTEIIYTIKEIETFIVYKR